MEKEKDFFDEQTPSSRIKANIVANYFPKYCRILLKKPQDEIRYLDLFAGPGKYKDGNHSTPLLLAALCAKDEQLSKKVRLCFNDKKHSAELRNNFMECFPDSPFELKPRFGDKTVGENEKIEKYLSKPTSTPKNPYPTLLFFDPFGYKGIDTVVLSKFLMNWGNEIFLFVNIKRIHAAIENNKFDDLMLSLFPTTFGKIKNDRKYKAQVHERLNLIMDNLAFEFRKNVSGELYDCSFKFQEEDSSATSHFIIHFTKHKKGYELVKQVYYDFDNIGATLDKDGNYTYDAKRMDISANSSFDFGDQNVALLSKQLAETYKGKTITAKKLFDEHQPSSKWCGRHYRDTLRDMEHRGLIKTNFTDHADHKVTVLLIDECMLEFK